MDQSTKLIFNSVVTYGRMVLTVGMGLVTTRLVLRSLGEEGYGLLGVLGGSLAFLSILRDAIGHAAQRHLAYELGTGDAVALRRVFNTTLAVYPALGSVIAAAGLAMMVPILHVLAIPADKLGVAWWCYLSTLAYLVLVHIEAPFTAVNIARQNQVLDAALAALYSFGLLVLSASLPYLPLNPIIAFAWGGFFLLLLLLVVRIAFVVLLYPEARPRPSEFDWGRLRGLLSFAGWSTLWQVAYRVESQGSPIVLNLFFGLVANAAYNVAHQVRGYQISVTAAIVNAAQSAVVTVGASNAVRMRQLALTTSKFSLLAATYYTVPALLEVGLLLDLWLVEVPPWTAGMTAFLLLATLVEQPSAGHEMALRAVARIGGVSAGYAALASLTLAGVSVAYWLLGGSPLWMAAALVLSSFVRSLIRVALARRHAGIGVREWVRVCLVPVACVTVVAMSAALVPYLTMPPGGWRLLAVFGCYGLAGVPAAWWLALSDYERARFAGFARGAAARLRRRSGAADVAEGVDA